MRDATPEKRDVVGEMLGRGFRRIIFSCAPSSAPDTAEDRHLAGLLRGGSFPFAALGRARKRRLFRAGPFPVARFGEGG